jgi:hypothetical protein
VTDEDSGSCAGECARFDVVLLVVHVDADQTTDKVEVAHERS